MALMPLAPYKFVVQAVPQVLDDKGAVIGEAQTQPVTLYGCDALADWAKSFPAELAKAETQA